MFESMYTISCLMNVFQSFNLQRVIYYFNIINLSKIASVPRNIYVYTRREKARPERWMSAHATPTHPPYIYKMSTISGKPKPNGIYSCILGRLYL